MKLLSTCNLNHLQMEPKHFDIVANCELCFLRAQVKVVYPIIHRHCRMNTIVPKVVASEPVYRQGQSDRVFDVQAALERVEGNRELLGKMIGLFAMQWRQRLAEIAKAGERRDGAALEMVANQLKQSLGSFGAGKARQIALKIEELGGKREFDDLRKKSDSLRIEIEWLVDALKEFSRQKVPGDSP
jgi:HPt (histidine-containing phosphotransfer) domain-containing protein